MFDIYAFKSLSQPYHEKELYTIRFAIMRYRKCDRHYSYCTASTTQGFLFSSSPVQ